MHFRCIFAVSDKGPLGLGRDGTQQLAGSE